MPQSASEEPVARAGVALVRATMPFAREDRARTWSLFLSAAALLGAAWLVAWTAPLPLALAASVLSAGLFVRLFIFVHDLEHRAIFRGDRLGRACVAAVAALTFTSLPVWRKVHDYHHRRNGEPLVPPLAAAEPADLLNRTVTVEEWRALPRRVQRRMRLVSHPLTMLLGFGSVFVFGNGLLLMVRDRELRGVPAFAAWAAAFALLVALGGWGRAALVLLLPNVISSAVGVYLFYAQHHFPDARIRPAGEWSLHDAALHASSFLDAPRWVHWFTGNIGYHHVHHVNHRIPFYRLPEAMAAIPELQSPGRTGLAPGQIRACLQCNVWDPARERLVSFDEASAGGAAPR